MATQPTQNPVPSESPRDLKFNAGKIDEFVTSLAQQYQDRFGNNHYTIEGIRWLAQQAISQYGYITVDSFQAGANITLPNQVLRDTSNGEYYRWDGQLPKTVPAQSTPQTAGGIGVGKWLGVGSAVLGSSQDGAGDALVTVKQPYTGAALRTQHEKNTDVLTIFDFLGVGDGTALNDGAVAALLAASGNVLNLSKGNWRISQSITVDCLVMAPGATLTSTVPVNVVCKSIVAPPMQIVSGQIALKCNQPGYAEWFGAKGDGLSDDLAAFNMAHNALSGIYLLSKKYLISNKFEIKKPFMLRGMSPEVSVILSNAVDKDIVAVTTVNGSVGDDNASVTLSDFSVEYIGSQAPSAGAGINVTYCSYANVKNLKIKKTFNGIYHTTALGCVFEGVSILGCYNDALYMDTNSIDFIVKDVIIDGQTAYSSGVRRTNVGVYIYGSQVEGWVLESIRCTMCKRPILIDAALSTARNCPSFGRISNCFFDTANVSGSLAKAREITVSNSWFSSNAAESGLSLGITHGVTFSQSQFINNAQHGLILSASANFTVINNCQFSSNSAASTTGSGVVVSAGTNNFTITNNLFDNSSLSATQRWGVFVNAGASTNYIIAFNQCYGNVSGGVSDGGTGSQKLVQTNFV